MTDKNLCSKTTDLDHPYEIWKPFDGTWEWRVLKKYQKPSKEKDNRFARWFCGVKSPFTYGSFELGDVYISDIKDHARLVSERINLS